MARKVGGKPEKGVPKAKHKGCVCEERPMTPNTAGGPLGERLKNDLGLSVVGITDDMSRAV